MRSTSGVASGADEELTIDLEPTRLTVGMTPDPDNPRRVSYRFAALTATASIPERAIMLNRARGRTGQR